ncbi:Lovastatin diketide synthase LovF 13 [Colletotrichum chlorophyti]|uniref:Lovastatin diketide synthase LovF 13 n=1 Tax=Colletotrichum chlorophyti TaxID=708187 RepID=A0A1Q8RMZ3_9PEZI|nr:Lovastatin diketide synthase LovF 13 [Colletotrichum chlorophyti]
MEDIAIVGMACRFPGKATSPEKLWQMMVDKESAWSEFPEDRLNIDGYYHPSGDRQGSISFRGAHFIRDDVAAFDASFFSVMAEDAKAIDPQQRFLLEVSYEALENAGLRVEDLKGSSTAVYVGSFVKDYEQICLRDMDWQPQYAATGTGNAIMSNRVSYTYDFKGPSMTIDTGCSGSLVAVHLAAQALRAGDCSLALAAGAGLILTPNTMMPMTALNFLSPDGKCFAFDSRANGYGRGEGIGFVVLKKLSDAVRDNDTIRAVIRGTHVNQDGSTPGITLPSKEAQVANIRSLYSKHNLDMQQTAFVECHGTGTQAGDFRELKAISETLSEGRQTNNPVYVGSVKTNIGHLEGAAGVAGLIKGVLVTEKGQIPPNINFETGNPNIDFENWKVKVPKDLTQWPLDGTRRISVNCFGFGGTNAHAVLDEPSSYLSERGILAHHNSKLDDARHGQSTGTSKPGEQFSKPQLFAFSSNERKGVSRLMNTHLEHITGLEEFNQTDADNYAYTLACRRSVMEWKGFVVANSKADLAAKLNAKDEASFARSSRESKPKIAFVFCGQGAQWPQMGLELMCFKAFRNSLVAAANYLKTIGSDFDLLNEIMKCKPASRVQDPRISQPATTAVQVALVDLLRSCNITPSSVVGHSSGEIAAAYAATSITRESAWAISYHRGRTTSGLKRIAPLLKGAMCAVRMSYSEAMQYLARQEEHRDLAIACINSPNSVTISGQHDDVLWMRDDLKSSRVLCKVLDVDIAYHSEHMKLVQEDYKQSIGSIRPESASKDIKFFSSVRGDVLPHDVIDPTYWAANLASPVQFVQAVKSMMKSANRPDIFVELSPHATLQSPLAEIIAEYNRGFAPKYVSLIRRNSDTVVTTLQAIGDIWVRGYPANLLKAISRGTDEKAYKTLANLPSYPWNHSKTFWHESHTCTEHRFRNFGRQDLIGAPSPDATTFEPRWRGFFRISENPWVQDHRVQKTIVYPAAGMVVMALEAASQLSVATEEVLGFHLTDMRIERAMIIPSTAFGLEYSLNLKQLHSKSEEDPIWEFAIYSKDEDGPWIRHADGRISIRRKGDASPVPMSGYRDKYLEIQSLSGDALPPRQLYELLDVVGLNYGPCFQNVVSVATHRNSCVSKVRIPDTKSKMPANFEYPHIIHPATLDSMFQTLFAIESKPMVPSQIDSVFISASMPQGKGQEFIGFATAERRGICDATGSIVMVSDTEKWDMPSLVVDGLHFTALSTPSIEDGGFIPNHRNLCSEIVWKEDYPACTAEDLPQIISLMAHKCPSIAVLQCGGDEKMAREILKTLSEDGSLRLSRYTMTGQQTMTAVSQAFEKSPVANLLEQRDWNACEGFHARYNLIIADRESGINIQSANELLLPEGVFLAEVASTDVSESVYFSKEAEDSPEKLAPVTVRTGAGRRRQMLDQQFEAHILIADIESASLPEVLIILPDTIDKGMVDFVQCLGNIMSIKGFRLSTGTLHDSDPKDKACISLLEVSDNFVYNWTEQRFRDFHKLQKTAKSLLWITRAANRRPTDPRNAPIIALARTIMSEDPQKVIVTLDLDEHTSIASETLPKIVQYVLESVISGSGETEFAEEGGKVYIPRLMPLKDLNRMIESESQVDIVRQPIFNHTSDTKPYQMVVSKSGITEDSFHFVESKYEADLDPYEVEIKTLSAALHPADLQTVLGRTSENKLGLDVMGVITKVGSLVSGFRCGDRVLAIVPGAFKTVHRVNSFFVKHAQPLTTLFNHAPSALLAAHYAIFTVGRPENNKKVLIHAGASAYGQAAIHAAIHSQQELFVTVMGQFSEEQREILHSSYQIPDDHILDANGDSFVAVLQTIGKVDLVYNPTQEHVATNFKCVKASGCVVQLADKTGRAINVPVTSSMFVKLDIGLLQQEEPGHFADILNQVEGFVSGFVAETKQMECHSVHQFYMSDFGSALKQVENNPNFGLTIMTANEETCVSVAKEIRTKPLAAAIDDGTYVLAGGLGGLGKSIAKLLADNGAKRIVFLSRSGGNAEGKSFLESLKAQGVDVEAKSVDITSLEALRTLLPDLGKVSGVVQCAAVLKDSLFENMTHEDWTTAFGPKAIGAANLAEVFGSGTADAWFLFLSSASGIIGNRGQANYAAANAVQDALARSGRLTRAVSLDLGPVLEAGMLVEDEETLDKLRGAGFYGIRHRDFLTMVTRAITGEIVTGVPTPAQIISGVGTGGLIRQNNPGDPFWSRTALYSFMNTVDMPVIAPGGEDTAGGGAGEADVKRMLAACSDMEAAAGIVCAGLVQLMAKTMILLPEEIDPERTPSAYGVDSLVAVGIFRNAQGVDVSVFEILGETSIRGLAGIVAGRGKW